MTPIATTAGLTLLASLGFWLFSAAVLAAAYPIVGAGLGKLQPQTRCGALLAWSFGPVLFAASLTAVCFLPSILSAAGFGADHCLTHDDHHVHLCLMHPHASQALGPIGMIMVGMAALWWSLGITWELLRAVSVRRFLARLAVLRAGGGEDVSIVSIPEPVAFTAGIKRARVYISSSLISLLPPVLLRVVTEHEQAHLRRRDHLRKFVASVFSLGHAPGMRRRLLSDLALACEQACDEEAAARIGDRLIVAEAIVSVERLFGERPRSALPGWSFTGANVAARVESLLDPPSPPMPRLRRAGAIASLALILLSIASADSLHHATETLLGVFVR